MKRKKLVIIHFVLFFLSSGCAESKKDYNRSEYLYTADLNNLVNDQIKVELIPPHITSDTVEFVFPVSELAYYNDDLNHGKLISNLKAYNAQGQFLKTKHTAANRWTIYEAKSMEKLEYAVDDIWEVRDSLSSWLSSENIFDKDKVIQLSPNATFGYFEGHDQKKFKIVLIKPQNLYLCSGLINNGNANPDTIKATNFLELSDYPLLFTDQKPVQFEVGNSIIEVGIYSEQGKIKVEWVVDQIKPALQAISDYFYGNLPSEKYAFMIYFYQGPIFAATASEHNTSSLWVQPEDWDENILGSSMGEMIKNTALHEFLHIYTPLNIHSEEKLQFDFDQPKMSKHLWFYEGTTTYVQELIKVNQKLITEEYFFNYIKETLKEMQSFRTDVSLTEISAETYGDELGDEYDNVELRGFLVNMILDIKLREESKGSYGLKDLVLDLSKKFGKDKSFKDDDFFKEIAKVTQLPELVAFFDKYVGGTAQLPLEEVFGKVGLAYNGETNTISIMKTMNEEQNVLKNQWLYHE